MNIEKEVKQGIRSAIPDQMQVAFKLMESNVNEIAKTDSALATAIRLAKMQEERILRNIKEDIEDYAKFIEEIYNHATGQEKMG